ncbi:MAG: ABC transporter permease [Betaproteobacteria bacterium]
MQDFSLAFAAAASLLWNGDAELWHIIRLSLAVSLTATLIATLIGAPLGAMLAIGRFAGRRVVVIVLNGFMGLPPVVVGLVVYLLLSRSGPLGALGILFTAKAMVIAQTLLITPIIASLMRQVVEDAWSEYREQLVSLGASPWKSGFTLLWDTRYSLITALLAGFGRAAAEVGAVMIVGGNIANYTRVMTTAIALETTKGDLPLALALGFVLIAIIIGINAIAFWIRNWAQRRFR